MQQAAYITPPLSHVSSCLTCSLARAPQSHVSPLHAYSRYVLSCKQGWGCSQCIYETSLPSLLLDD